MRKRERELVSYVAKSAQSLLDAKSRSQEHAARYMLVVAIENLHNWAIDSVASTPAKEPMA